MHHLTLPKSLAGSDAASVSESLSSFLLRPRPLIYCLPSLQKWLLTFKPALQLNLFGQWTRTKKKWLPLQWINLGYINMSSNGFEYSKFVYLCVFFLVMQHSCILITQRIGQQVKRSFGLCNLQVTYYDEDNEEVRYPFKCITAVHTLTTVL